MLISPEGQRTYQTLNFKFQVSNKEAEYEALLVGLRMALHMGVKHVAIYSDSQLVVNQILGEYEVKGAKMIKYWKEAKSLLSKF